MIQENVQEKVTMRGRSGHTAETRARIQQGYDILRPCYDGGSALRCE